MNLGQLRAALDALPHEYDGVPVLVMVDHYWDLVERVKLDEDRVILRHTPFLAHGVTPRE